MIIPAEKSAGQNSAYRHLNMKGAFAKRRRPSLSLRTSRFRRLCLGRLLVSGVSAWALLGFAPDDVFVVSAIDERVDFSVIGVAKKNAALHAFTEKYIGSLLHELLAFAFSFDVQLFDLGRDDSGLSGCQLVGTNKVCKFFWIGLTDRGIFIIAHSLTGDDLPRTITLQPGVGAVIASGEILAENRFRLIKIVTQDRGIAMDDALRFGDLDRARITAWQWCDVGDQRCLVQGASFFIGKDAVIREIFFPWLCVAWNHGIE